MGILALPTPGLDLTDVVGYEPTGSTDCWLGLLSGVIVAREYRSCAEKGQKLANLHLLVATDFNSFSASNFQFHHDSPVCYKPISS